MTRSWLILFVLAAFFAGSPLYLWAQEEAPPYIPPVFNPPPPPTTFTPYFSPRGFVTTAVVQAIAGAEKEVLMQAYTFTSPQIAQALLAAKAKGRTVFVILDAVASREASSVAPVLLAGGIIPLIDAVHPIAHNKVLIIDGTTVITGSFNYTRQAECCNAENLLVITNVPELAAQYKTQLLAHANHSTPYKGK